MKNTRRRRARKKRASTSHLRPLNLFESLLRSFLSRVIHFLTVAVTRLVAALVAAGVEEVLAEVEARALTDAEVSWTLKLRG